MNTYEEKIGWLESQLDDARKALAQRERTLRQLELELQAAALLLASAKDSSNEDGSRICRRQFSAVADRFLEIEVESRGG